MGSACLPKQRQLYSNNLQSLYALVMIDKNEKIIKILDQKVSDNQLTQSFNSKEDTLLHLCCKRDNLQLAKYILRRNVYSRQIKNQSGQLPHEMSYNKTSQYILDGIQKQKYLKKQQLTSIRKQINQ